MAEVLFRVAYDLAWLPVVTCVKICGGGVSLSSTKFEGGGKHAPNTPITLDASTIPSPTIAIKVSYFVTGSYQLAGWISCAQPRRLINPKTLGILTMRGDPQSSGVTAYDN